MRFVTRLLCIAAVAAAFVVAPEKQASAGHPVYYAPATPVVPAVVGYSARRGGLFGQRVVMRPVVAPVAAAPVIVAPPVVTAYYPPAVPAVAVPVRSYRVPYATIVPVYPY